MLSKIWPPFGISSMLVGPLSQAAGSLSKILDDLADCLAVCLADLLPLHPLEGVFGIRGEQCKRGGGLVWILTMQDLLRASFPLVSASIFLLVEPESQLLFCYSAHASWKSWR